MKFTDMMEAAAAGIFGARTGAVPAIAGMLVGIVFTGIYILGTVYLGWPRWCFGIGPQGIGIVGMMLNFATAMLLTPFCRPPSRAVREMVELIREPEGAGPGVDIEAAPER